MSRYHNASRMAESDGAKREREIHELDQQFDKPPVVPTNRSLHQQLLAAGVEIDNHESDLYAKVTPESTRILEDAGIAIDGHNASVFTSQVDGERWYDLPFAYEPFWDKKQRHASAAMPGKSRKPVFGHANGMNYAVKVDSLDSNEFFRQPFGRQLDDGKRLKAWKESTDTAWIGAKGKPTILAVRRWIKENKPAEFYAKWQSDGPNHKDDSVEIHYR